jgi:hypothetical protein
MMKMLVRVCVGIILLMLVVLFVVPFREGVAVMRHLPFGWLGFLRRTLPEVTLNWAGIGMVLLCSVVILLLLHGVLNGLTGKRSPFRRSASILIGLWLLFCLIIGVAGLTRSTALLRGEEWYQRRFTRGDLKNASLYASMALNDSGNDVQSLKRMLRDPGNSYGRPLWEEFEFLVCAGVGGKAPSVVVIPREGKARANVGFSIVSDADSEDFIPISRLDEKLAMLRASVRR